MSAAHQSEEDDDAVPQRLQYAEDAREAERARRMAEAMGLEDEAPAAADLVLPPSLPPLAKQALRRLVTEHGSPAVHDALQAIDAQARKMAAAG